LPLSSDIILMWVPGLLGTEIRHCGPEKVFLSLGNFRYPWKDQSFPHSGFLASGEKGLWLIWRLAGDETSFSQDLSCSGIDITSGWWLLGPHQSPGTGWGSILERVELEALKITISSHEDVSPHIPLLHQAYLVTATPFWKASLLFIWLLGVTMQLSEKQRRLRSGKIFKLGNLWSFPMSCCYLDTP
jgi:hypothetical protein